MAKLVFNITIMTFNSQKESARKREEIGDRIEGKKKQRWGENGGRHIERVNTRAHLKRRITGKRVAGKSIT